MIKIDLSPYLPTHTYDNGGKSCFVCGIRKKFIRVTPEEKVRQALICYLVQEKGFPVENFRIEVPMSHFTRGAKGRADVVIMDDDGLEPLMIIECKEPRELITDAVLDQVARYWELVPAITIMVATGDLIYLIAFVEEVKGFRRLSEMPTYKELFYEGGFEYEVPTNDSEQRLPHEEPFDETLVNHYIEEGYIGNATDKKYYRFIFNLSGFLFQEKEVLIFDNISDLGIRISKFGNVGGGSFGGDYRAFMYKTATSNHIASISVFGSYGGEEEGLKRGKTYFMVALDDEKGSHLSLELQMDKYVTLVDDKAIVQHDGTLTVGKLGAAKRNDVVEFVRAQAPHLVNEDGIVMLGEFDLREAITGSQDQTRQFIKNAIQYAILRDEYRAFHKSDRLR